MWYNLYIRLNFIDCRQFPTHQGGKGGEAMTPLSDAEHIRAALGHLAQEKLPDPFPFGSVCIKRQENHTVCVIVEMTFRIPREQVGWFNYESSAWICWRRFRRR